MNNFERSPQESPSPETSETNIADVVLEMWQQQLPETLKDPTLKKEYDTASVMKAYDTYLAREQELDRKNEGTRTLARIQNDQETTNNFYLWFSPESVRGALKGDKRYHEGIKSFYINYAFNGAWTRMCEQYPEDVKKVIQGEGFKPRTCQKELKNLALYLHEVEGIPIMFLIR